ncbi:MAG TPA: isoprenyl transferase [Tenericutes bacterium]|jgi:undecaprenyl diphosphate synthase|nr:isoprenyl transferase [Mycoplasmatota bacterium]
MLENELNIPNHIAIIMDGNGRWAKERGMKRTDGHLEGSKNLKRIVEHAQRLGIKVVTVYAFSTENWSRPKEEVDYLMNLIKEFFTKHIKELYEKNIKITFMGRRDRLSSDVLKIINEIKEKTKNNDGIILNIGLDYGGQDEILEMVKKIATKVQNKEITIENIDKNIIEENLMTSGLPPVDFMIRTSGELRLSNFLLWQLAYAELYFVDTYWPDFDGKALEQAIVEYNRRNRRFGGIKDDNKNN